MAASLSWKDLALLDRLGEGQAGAVWTARLRRSFRGHAEGEVVAVKRYKRWVLEQPGQFERVFRELNTGSRVVHPNVVTTYCVVVDDEGLPNLVMPYYDGITLEAFLSQHRQENEMLAPDGAFALLRGIALGVLALHNVGAIHRDIKPANIIVRKNGTPVVMDLGVVTETLLPEHTRTDQFLGSIRYAHRDYLTGRRCSMEVDAYSVGCIAYELLFGERFLGEETNWAVLVSRIVSWKTPAPDHVAELCHKLTSMYSQEVAEAAYWIVRHLIWEPTTKSLAQLTSAIDRQFWTSPFTENGEGIELGVPPQFQSLEENPDNPDSWQEWFDSMWRNPSTRGLNPEGEDLEALLRSRYWRWRCLLDDGEFVDDELTDIESDLGFFFDLANLGSPDIADFADALLMAHRYGLFGAGEAP